MMTIRSICSPYSPIDGPNGDQYGLDNWVNANTGFAQSTNAPADVPWAHCVTDVFAGGIWKDENESPFPSGSDYFGRVLDRLFEYKHPHQTKEDKRKVIIMHGKLDSLLKYNATVSYSGTALAVE